MRFLKSKLSIIIPIICIIIFGSLYLFELNNKKVAVVGRAKVEEVTPAANGEVAQPKEKSIKVYVTGAVQSPGVYELPQGSRVEDALALAGGSTEGANLEKINLAAFLTDAQQIKVPLLTPQVDKTENSLQNSMAEESNGLVNINTDDISELMKLPGVGQVTAGNIIAYREKNGDFQTIEELKNVTRIGEKTFEKLKELISVN